MCRPQSPEWKALLPKIQGMWPGKTIQVPTRDRDDALRVRALVFNIAHSIKPEVKIRTSIEYDGPGMVLVVEKIINQKGK